MTTLAPERAAILAAVAHPEALATLVTIDGPDGPEPFDLWPDQRGLIRTILSSARVLVLKARQLGVTWTLALLALWWALSHPAQTVLIVSIGEREAVDVLRRVRRLYESLPAIVREHFPLGQSTSTRMEIDHSEGAGVIVSLPSSSTAGRGQTVHLLIGDERPKWPNAAEQEASLLPAAADSGKIVLGGTANGFDSFRDRWMATEQSGWVPVFIGALARPGRTRDWVMTEREALGELGPQEYPLTAEEAFLATGRSAFDREALTWYSRASCAPAPWRGTLRRDAFAVTADAADGGPWRVWSWPEQGRDYVIVADTSGGHGEDYSAATVIDLGSWDEVACYHAKVEPAVLAEELRNAGHLWRGPREVALLVPELNNHGQAVVALLREWNYPRLYRTEHLDRDGNPTGVTYGWNTTESSRRIAISSLQRGLRERTLGIRDAKAIDEMHRFVWVVVNEATGTGRYQAGDGANDDRVMAWSIAAAVLAHSESLAPLPAMQPVPAYQPRVSGVTGYHPKFFRGWWL